MKKMITFMAAIASVVAMVSCNKVESPAPASKIGIEIDVVNADATRAVQTTWEKGNVIYVFFNGNYNAETQTNQTYVVMEFDGTQWISSCAAEGYLETLPSVGKMTAIFASKAGDMGYSSSNGNLYIQNSKVNSYYKKKYALHTRDFLFAPETDYAIVGSKIKGTLKLSRGSDLIDLQVSVSGVDTEHEYYFISSPITSINYFFINTETGSFGRTINGRGNTQYYQGGLFRGGDFVVYAKKPTAKNDEGVSVVTPLTLDQEIEFILVDFTLQKEYSYKFNATQALVDAWAQANTAISVNFSKFSPVE